MEKKYVRWGILGTANIAKNAVGPAILEASNANLYAVAGRTEEKITDFIQKNPCTKTYLSYDELLEDPDVEAIYIPLPNGLHREWAIKAMKQGKHVLCEKPLACSADEVREMIEVSKETKMNLEEAFAYRHNPMIIKMKELVDTGKIGKLRFIESNFSFMLDNRNDIRFDKTLGGGATYDVGCYPIHLIRYFVGDEPTKVISSVDLDIEKGIDLNATVIMEFPGNVIGTFYAAFDSSANMSCRIVGTKGILKCRKPYNQSGRLEIIFKSDDIEEIIAVHSPNNYTLEIESFSRGILEGTKAMNTLADSLKNAHVIDQILKG